MQKSKVLYTFGMSTLQKENLAKNVLLIVLLIVLLYLLYPRIQTSILQSPVVNDVPLAGDMMVAVSILIVTACFGNFAFTYEKIRVASGFSRMLAHITTGLLMLLIGLSLEMTAVLASVLVGAIPILNFSLLLLYIASVFYDIWDVERINL